MAGSAATIFNALCGSSRPFYLFFHIRRLEELNFVEMKTLAILLLSGGNQEQAVQKVLENEAKLKAFYSFTCGNPRMVVFLKESEKGALERDG